MHGILDLDIPVPTKLYLREITTGSDPDFLAGSVFGSEWPRSSSQSPDGKPKTTLDL
jgi:hypothetical protein